MDALRLFLNSLSREEQDRFAQRCGTSVAYLRKAISIGQTLGIDLVISIDRETGGKVSCEQLRPDVDWKYLAQRALACR